MNDSASENRLFLDVGTLDLHDCGAAILQCAYSAQHILTYGCKRITLRAVANRKHHSRKVRRRHKNLPAFEHHIIEIKDLQGRVAGGESLTTAIQHGLHIVRGHFSAYTKTAPLLVALPERFGFRRMYAARFHKA